MEIVKVKTSPLGNAVEWAVSDHFLRTSQYAALTHALAAVP
jgi:hypothetical protein